MAAVSLAGLESNLNAQPNAAFPRFKILLDFASGEIDEAIHEVGGEDALISRLHALYDAYVAPVDVPYIPDLAEPFVIDQPAKSLLTAAVKWVHMRVHREGA